jgi:aminopeptidase N
MLPRAYLKAGKNTVTINYTAPLSNDGYGCLWFIDTTETPHKYYTYTHFEPYSAHKVFPCFDQPDLKAQMSLNIIAPLGWIAGGNEHVGYDADYDQVDYQAHAPQPVEQDLLTKYLTGKEGHFYILDQTKLLPTYLFCMIVD